MNAASIKLTRYHSCFMQQISATQQNHGNSTRNGQKFLLKSFSNKYSHFLFAFILINRSNLATLYCIILANAARYREIVKKSSACRCLPFVIEVLHVQQKAKQVCHDVTTLLMKIMQFQVLFVYCLKSFAMLKRF